MNITRARDVLGARPAWVRMVMMAFMAALLVPFLMTASAGPASAEEDDPENYSLYQLSSNASAYFGNENSPSSDGEPNDTPVDDRMSDEWHTITKWPAAGGSLLGYADPEFSISLEWLTSELSGSSQTISYDSLVARDDSGQAMPLYSGMLDYAYFGAANSDLGLDSMSSGVMGGMTNAITGSVIWFLYGLAIMVGTLFYFVIQVLKFVNPFLWFYDAVHAINPTFAEGMTQGTPVPGPLSGLANFINSWYGVIVDMAWGALVPIFIGVLAISLLLFKKMDRGSAIKKLVVRVLFIGLGLPLLGSMYTQVLDQFDDSMMGQHAGPTRVVLSTYVDFEAWMMNDRLMIPDEAAISWNPHEGHAWPDSTMAVRNTALAINKQSHGSVYDDINISAGNYSDGGSVWSDNYVSVEEGETDRYAFMETIGILNRFISGDTVAASDFETEIKSTITQLPNSGQTSAEEKRKWFVDEKTYGDTEKFGTEDDPKPPQNPMIAPGGTPGQTGLQSTASTGSGEQTGRDFSSQGVNPGCGSSVMAADNNGAAYCNLSPLAAYNYLNTGFDSSAMTLYSSNKATSGFTRENHQAVSQVGTGPASFMYFLNTGTILACIVLLGFCYAIGMLATSVRRTFGVVAAVPFATLGAMAAISKVIIYSVALIMEVIVTLFLYQLVSEFLITLPDIVAGPFAAAFADGEIFGSWWAGAVMVVLMTFLSTVLTIGVTFALLRVRKSVIKAMDEAVTKMVDKFLETDTPPALGKSGGGGALPALASGVGAGVGMAAGNKLAAGIGSKAGGGSKGSDGNGGSGSTNVGGTNGPGPRPLGGGGDLLQLERGDGDGSDDDGADNSRRLPGGTGGPGGSGGGKGIDGSSGAGSDGRDLDSGSQMQRSADQPSSQTDKSTASKLQQQGGLSNLGFSRPAGTPGQAVALSPQEAGRLSRDAISGEVVRDTAGAAGGGTNKRPGATSAAGSSATNGATAARSQTPKTGNKRSDAASYTPSGSAGATSVRAGAAGAAVPAGPGNLPTRKEQQAYLAQRAAQGMPVRNPGPVLDDVNPQAAKAVDAAGGTKAYLAQQQAGAHTTTGSAAAQASGARSDAPASVSPLSRTSTPSGAPLAQGRGVAPTAQSAAPVVQGRGVTPAQQTAAPSAPQAGARQVAPQAPARVAPAAPAAQSSAPVVAPTSQGRGVAPAPQVGTPQAAAPSAAPVAQGRGVTPAQQAAAPSAPQAGARQVAPQAPARVAPAPSAPQVAAPSAAPVAQGRGVTPAQQAAAPSAPQAGARQVAPQAPARVAPAAQSGSPVVAPTSQGRGVAPAPHTPGQRERRGLPRKDAQVSVSESKRNPWWKRKN